MAHHSQMTSFDVNEVCKNFQADLWLSEQFGCEWIPGQNGWLSCSCPFDDHPDTSPSFGLNLDKGIFNCFGCGKSGSFIKLVSILLNKSFAESLKLISDCTGYDISALNTIEHKFEKLKSVLEEKDQEKQKLDKLVLKATIKIKKIMQEDFDLAEKYFKELDELIVQNNRKVIKEFIDERIK